MHRSYERSLFEVRKAPLEAYRPFLSYNELGSLLDEGPSKLYDALSKVLGLDALVDAQTALQQARSARDKARKDADQEGKALLVGLRTWRTSAPSA